MLNIAQEQNLTQEENDYLNKLDNQITMIMLNAENKINSQETSPWSPEFHIAIRKVTLWKLTLTQLKTNIFQHKPITSIQQTLKTTVNGSELIYISTNQGYHHKRCHRRTNHNDHYGNTHHVTINT